LKEAETYALYPAGAIGPRSGDLFPHLCRREDKFQSVYIYPSQCLKSGRFASVSTAQICSTSLISLNGKPSSSLIGTDGGNGGRKVDEEQP
jgi:hypothetical protein